jgi:hypothetical protein
VNQTLVEMHAAAAFIANQVMMVFARLDHFIAAFAVAQIDCLHKPLPNQGFKRSVHGGQTRCSVVVCS